MVEFARAISNRCNALLDSSRLWRFAAALLFFALAGVFVFVFPVRHEFNANNVFRLASCFFWVFVAMEIEMWYRKRFSSQRGGARSVSENEE